MLVLGQVVLARCWDAMLDGDVLTGNRLLCGWWSGEFLMMHH
jgi:hypothetical protein